MDLCFLADARNIHFKRWIEPIIELGYKVHIISYMEDVSSIAGAADFVDLTKIFNIRKVRSFIWGPWIYRYLRTTKPAIFHVHQMPSAGLIIWMAHFHPTIVTAWGSDLLVTPRKSIFWNRMTRFSLKHIDYLTVPSQIMYDAALELRYPEHKLSLIPWGLETNVFRPEPDDRIETRRRLNIPEESQLLLSPRAIAPLYNHDLILAAFRQLVTKFPNLHLALIKYNVDIDFEDILLRKIRALQLQAKVIWLDAQSSMIDMARLYRTADIVISVPDSEGYGFTAYEALACGCPAIVTDLPVFRNDLVNNIHVIKIPSNDLDRLTTSIEMLLVDKDLRQRLVKNGEDITRSMSSANRQAQMIELYDRAKESV